MPISQRAAHFRNHALALTRSVPLWVITGIRRPTRHSLPRDFGQERYQRRTGFLDHVQANQGSVSGVQSSLLRPVLPACVICDADILWTSARGPQLGDVIAYILMSCLQNGLNLHGIRTGRQISAESRTERRAEGFWRMLLERSDDEGEVQSSGNRMVGVMDVV